MSNPEQNLHPAARLPKVSNETLETFFSELSTAQLKSTQEKLAEENPELENYLRSYFQGTLPGNVESVQAAQKALLLTYGLLSLQAEADSSET